MNYTCPRLFLVTTGYFLQLPVIAIRDAFRKSPVKTISCAIITRIHEISGEKAGFRYIPGMLLAVQKQRVADSKRSVKYVVMAAAITSPQINRHALHPLLILPQND